MRLILEVWRFLWHFSGYAWYAFASVYMLMSPKKNATVQLDWLQTLNSATAVIIFSKLNQISIYISLLPFPLFLDKDMFQMKWKNQSSYEDFNMIVSFFFFFFFEMAIIKVYRHKYKRVHLHGVYPQYLWITVGLPILTQCSPATWFVSPSPDMTSPSWWPQRVVTATTLTASQQQQQPRRAASMNAVQGACALISLTPRPWPGSSAIGFIHQHGAMEALGRPDFSL